jgi:hypothetical protein
VEHETQTETEAQTTIKFEWMEFKQDADQPTTFENNKIQNKQHKSGGIKG